MTSIMAQTIGKDNLEIICIDDASTDKTWERLKIWEQLCPENVILIQQEINRRQGAARNIGLQYATADWIAFVDADDWLEPDYFEQLYTPVTQYACDVVVCGWEPDRSDSLVYFDENRRQSGEDKYIVVDSEREVGKLFGHKLLGEGPCAKILRREMLLDFQIFFPEDLAYEDHYWIPLLYLYTQKAYIIEKKLYHYYMNPNSTVRAKNKAYHIDWVTVQMMKWTDYENRGLWQKYREILEGDALYDAAGFIKMLILRYDEPSFAFFLLESSLIKKQVPNYENNRYIRNFSELYRLFLKAIYTSIDKTAFQEIVQAAREYMMSR